MWFLVEKMRRKRIRASYFDPSADILRRAVPALFSRSQWPQMMFGGQQALAQRVTDSALLRLGWKSHTRRRALPTTSPRTRTSRRRRRRRSRTPGASYVAIAAMGAGRMQQYLSPGRVIFCAQSGQIFRSASSSPINSTRSRRRRSPQRPCWMINQPVIDGMFTSAVLAGAMATVPTWWWIFAAKEAEPHKGKRCHHHIDADVSKQSSLEEPEFPGNRARRR